MKTVTPEQMIDFSNRSYDLAEGIVAFLKGEADKAQARGEMLSGAIAARALAVATGVVAIENNISPKVVVGEVVATMGETLDLMKSNLAKSAKATHAPHLTIV